MRIKFVISLVIFFVLSLIAILWLSRRENNLKIVSAVDLIASNNPVAESTSKPSVGAQQINTNRSFPPAKQTAPTTIDSVALNEKLRAEIEAKNVPFDFYGRVIDQESNSLSGVNIKLALRHWNTTTLGAIHIERETDSDGRFDIHGETGDAFDVEDVGKTGYELEPSQLSFGAVGGSIENPVVFKMWNTNTHEQLITGEKSFQIEPDGRPYVIDLSKGTIAESGSGDLKIWIKYLKQVSDGQLSDWSCEIDTINGGLLEEPVGTIMYEAPTEDYTPTFQLQQQIKGGQRGSIGTRQFYVKLNDGQQYGKITIELNAPFNERIPGLIRLQYAINPSGSRILR